MVIIAAVKVISEFFSFSFSVLRPRMFVFTPVCFRDGAIPLKRGGVALPPLPSDFEF